MATKKTGIRVPFTEKEIELIKKTPIKKIKDLAFILNRSPEAVRRKKWALENKKKDVKAKLNYKKKMREALCPEGRKYMLWSKSEEAFILKSPLPDKEIAKELKRSLGSVQVKRARLLKEQKKRKRK